MEYRHDKRFQCEVLRLSYDFGSRAGIAEFAEDNCSDMDGAIKVFSAIDPEVINIQTYSGEKKDTLYRKIKGEWHSR